MGVFVCRYIRAIRKFVWLTVLAFGIVRVCSWNKSDIVVGFWNKNWSIQQL